MGTARQQVKVDPVKLTTELAARRQVSGNNELLKAKLLQQLAEFARLLEHIK